MDSVKVGKIHGSQESMSLPSLKPALLSTVDALIALFTVVCEDIGHKTPHRSEPALKSCPISPSSKEGVDPREMNIPHKLNPIWFIIKNIEKKN